MKLHHKTLLLIVLFTKLLAAQTTATDTLRIVAYNTLNYGFPATNSCPQLLTQKKHGYLRTIVKYSNPDVLGLVKMNTTPITFSTDSIIKKVLDSSCFGCYDHTPFTNISGYKKVNMVYFKKAKLGFVKTTTLYSADPSISDINMHTLYYRAPNLASTHDTIFLHIILIHDASGSAASDAANRAAEIGGTMAVLNAQVTKPGNYIFMGDFNTQDSFEAGYQSMVTSTNVNTKFYDPINKPGDWTNNATQFAPYLTQSTRTTDFGDCGATCALNNRFDHILCTQPILQGSKQLLYIPNSYQTIGQDGKHTNKALLDSPTNRSVPANVLNALYYMSQHLPVALQLAVVPTALPLHLLHFEATNTLAFVPIHLSWATENEVNTHSFNIERSFDGLKFITINTQNAKCVNTNNNLYQYADSVEGLNLKESNATIYYRLKMIDNNGFYTYGPTITVTENNASNNYSIQPNPASNMVIIKGNEMETITILNKLGKIVYTKRITGEHEAIVSLEHFSKGIYFISIINKKGNNIVKKLLVQ